MTVGSKDPRVELYPEPRNLDIGFRQTTEPFAARQAPKAVGDCFLLAYARELHAALVTFDRALHEFARKQGHATVIPYQQREQRSLETIEVQLHYAGERLLGRPIACRAPGPKPTNPVDCDQFRIALGILSPYLFSSAGNRKTHVYQSPITGQAMPADQTPL